MSDKTIVDTIVLDDYVTLRYLTVVVLVPCNECGEGHGPCDEFVGYTCGPCSHEDVGYCCCEDCTAWRDGAPARAESAQSKAFKAAYAQAAKVHSLTAGEKADYALALLRRDSQTMRRIVAKRDAAIAEFLGEDLTVEEQTGTVGFDDHDLL